MIRRDLSKITATVLAAWLESHGWKPTPLKPVRGSAITLWLFDYDETRPGMRPNVMVVAPEPDHWPVHVDDALRAIAAAYGLDAWTDAYDAIIPRAVACLDCRKLMTDGTQAVHMADGWWCRTCAETGDGWHETTDLSAEVMDAARLWRTGTNKREVAP